MVLGQRRLVPHPPAAAAARPAAAAAAALLGSRRARSLQKQPDTAAPHGPARTKASPTQSQARAADPTPLHFPAAGDFGTGDGLQRGVLAGGLAYMSGKRTGPDIFPDLTLMLGDCAYHSGSGDEFRRKVFLPYRGLLPHLPIWPVIGNHDSYSFAGKRRPFFSLFSAAPRVDGPSAVSNTSAYLSWNVGAVHFVALETNHEVYCAQRALLQRPGAAPRFDCRGEGLALGEVPGEMEAWLRKDLRAAGADPSVRWLIAILHHSPYMCAPRLGCPPGGPPPPRRGPEGSPLTHAYTASPRKGDHNSDNTAMEPQSAFVRARLLPLLEGAGADLVLGGHSHSYQRMCLLDGHYGVGAALKPGMARTPSAPRRRCLSVRMFVRI